MASIFQRQLRDFDWVLFLLAVLIAMAGLVSIYSTTLQQEGLVERNYFVRQIAWFLIGIVLIFSMAFIPKKLVFNLAYILYGVGILALLGTFLVEDTNGTHRWFKIGGFNFQPSEYMKIVVVITLAKYFSDHHRQIQQFKQLIPPLIMVLLPTAIVILQPDLGTALVYIATLILVLFWSGIRPLYFFLLLAPVISMLAAFNIFSFFVWMAILVLVLYIGQSKLWFAGINFFLNVFLGGLTNVLWGMLKPYQQQRISSLFNLDADPLGAGYQLIQSMTAFGSGGMFGKGLGQGTQTHLKFLPEQHTDFIMTVLGEELGFVAIMLVLALFLFFILRLISIAYSARTRYTSLILFGTASVFLFHIFVNLAMIVGLMPVTGIPLPFMSYGGSFMSTCFLLLGVSQNSLSGNRV